jgi:hypothetical protein
VEVAQQVQVAVVLVHLVEMLLLLVQEQQVAWEAVHILLGAQQHLLVKI